MQPTAGVVSGPTPPRPPGAEAVAPPAPSSTDNRVGGAATARRGMVTRNRTGTRRVRAAHPAQTCPVAAPKTTPLRPYRSAHSASPTRDPAWATEDGGGEAAGRWWAPSKGETTTTGGKWAPSMGSRPRPGLGVVHEAHAGVGASQNNNHVEGTRIRWSAALVLPADGANVLSRVGPMGLWGDGPSPCLAIWVVARVGYRMQCTDWMVRELTQGLFVHYPQTDGWHARSNPLYRKCSSGQRDLHPPPVTPLRSWQ